MDERFDNKRMPILRKRAERARINVFRAAETDCKELKADLDRFQKSITRLNQENKSSENTEGDDV